MKKYLSFTFSNIARRLYFIVKSDFNKNKEFANTEEKMKKIEESLQILFGVYLDYKSFNWAGKGAIIVGFFLAHLYNLIVFGINKTIRFFLNLFSKKK